MEIVSSLHMLKRSSHAMTMILATSHPASSSPLPVSQRGFVWSQPAKIWEEGLICDIGTIGANPLSKSDTVWRVPRRFASTPAWTINPAQRSLAPTAVDET